MKNIFSKIITSLCLTISAAPISAQITDPVAHFRSEDSVANDTYMKWEADLNGDNHNEVFLVKKSEYDQDVKDNVLPSWFVYLANASGTAFTESEAVEDAEESADPNEEVVGEGGMPAIDPKVCFVGAVSEIGGARGIVAQQQDKKDSGDKVCYIYAYTVKGSHLKRTKLAEYNPDAGVNAIYNKYLKEDKRTVITPSVVAP